MKLFKLNRGGDLSPHDRPFYPTDRNVELVDNPDDADFILLSADPGQYFSQINHFHQYKHKMVVWVNNDNPDFLDDRDGVAHKLIAQPSGKELKHTVVPLVMTDHLKIHLDEEFVEKCRNQEKIYDYYFAGQFYGKRSVLLNFNKGNSVIRRTGSIYGLSDEAKLNSIKEFLMELGKARFGFAPRGVGSNSFRLYECLMVGTIPIATDIIEYPDEDIVDWDTIAINGSLDDLNSLIEKSESIDYDTVRSNGIEYYENHVKMDVLYSKILNNIINEDSSN